MPISVLAHLKFRPDATDEGVAALEAIIPDTRAFEGCLSIVIGRNADDPSNVVLIERWRSAEDHKAYMAWRAQSGSSSGMRDALGEPPAIQYLDELQAL